MDNLTGKPSTGVMSISQIRQDANEKHKKILELIGLCDHYKKNLLESGRDWFGNRKYSFHTPLIDSLGSNGLLDEDIMALAVISLRIGEGEKEIVYMNPLTNQEITITGVGNNG